MIAAGAKAISSFLGHANIAITFDLHGHLMPGSEAQAAGRLEAFLARSAGAVPISIPTDHANPVREPNNG